MELKSFRIKNFRSIVDTGWVPFSPDAVTVLVGQNESGKSSILEAINFALSTSSAPSDDDLRIDAPSPEVFCRIYVSEDVFDEFGEEAQLDSEEKEIFERFLASNSRVVEMTTRWERGKTKDGKLVFQPKRTIESQALANFLQSAIAGEQSDSTSSLTQAIEDSEEGEEEGKEEAEKSTPEKNPLITRLSNAVWAYLPLSVLFNESSGHLPSFVDIDEKGAPTGAGAQAAKNFLAVADIDLTALVKLDKRARENILNRANARVSTDFNSFWTQHIGKSGQLGLKCEIDHYSDKHGDKAGKEHLVFWISNGNTQLYPKQRSQGVRWFISFYLQLKASEKKKEARVFLLDEPGANLHAKAQTDVLKVINKLPRDSISVIYSTHSPHMLEYPKLFRVRAVQRDGDLDDSPSVVIDAHSLGTASSDTLSPVLTAMGVDLSHHQVIRKTNNVLLEEMSGYYYLRSFWQLSGQEKEAHFIAATGANKVEPLANMFRGWGLDFVVAVDDDKQGREAYKSIKKELFGDDEKRSQQNLLKLPNCPGIEDAFSKPDFKKYVLKDNAVDYAVSNSEYLRTNGKSKPVLAFNFALGVTDAEITWDGLDDTSKQNILAIVDAIATRLN